MVVKRKNVAKTGEVTRKDDFFDHQPAKLKPRRRRLGCGWGSCLVLILFGVLVAFLILLGLVASTGLFKIPIISAITYREEPKPIRLVEPANQSTEEIFSSLSGAKLNVTESQLTKLLQQPSTDGQLTFKQAQIAIEIDHAEIFALAGDDSQLVIRADFKPAGNDLILESIYLGYLKLPTGIAQRLIRFVSGENLSLLELLEQYNISSIELEPGMLILGISAEVQAELINNLDLGLVTGLSDLTGKTINDLNQGKLTNIELELLRGKLSEFPEEVKTIIESKI